MQNDLRQFRPENISEKVVLPHRWGTWANERVEAVYEHQLVL
jgi:hypothetical protein